MSNRSATRFSGILVLFRGIDGLEQVQRFCLTRLANLLKIRGFSVRERSFGALVQIFDSGPDIVFRELENLTRASITMRDITQRQRRLARVPFLPEIVQAIH